MYPIRVDQDMGKRIIYLTFAESIHSPLLETQVKELVKKISQNRDYQVDWIAFVSPTDYLFQREETLRLVEDLKEYEVRLILYYLPIVYSKLFLPRIWLLPFLALFGVIGLTHYHSFYGFPRIIHSRGYMSTLVSIITKRLIGNAEIIFDPRSLFVDENVSAKNWRKDSIDYKVWKWIETFLVRNANVLVGVSNGFRTIIDNLHSNKQPLFYVIPCSVNLANFKKITQFEYDKIRNSLNFSVNDFVLVYSGSLGRWNSPSMIAKYIYYSWEANPNVRALILTSQTQKVIEDEFNYWGFPLQHCRFAKVNPGEISKYLQICNLGIQVMEPSLDSHTRLGVKFVEYLAAGLPVIVNSNAGAAKDYVAQYRVGAIIDNPKSEIAQALNNIQNSYSSISMNCSSLAERIFAVDIVLDQYLEIYDLLLGKEILHVISEQ